MKAESAGPAKQAVISHLEASSEVKLRLRQEADAIARVAQVWAEALGSGRKIMFCGNGGSAADSQHLAAEFVGRMKLERKALPAIALTVDTSALTALSNDYGYEQVFARQVEALGQEGDVLVGLSTSGNSKNILEAFQAARGMGITTVAMTGEGGKLREAADYAICVPSSNTPHIQEAHIAAGHIMAELAERAATDSPPG